MKKAIFTLLLASGILASCAGTKGEQTAEGIIYDAAMNTLVIVTPAQDTLWFMTTDADKTQAPGMLIGTKVEVTYKDSSDIKVAQKVVALP